MTALLFVSFFFVIIGLAVIFWIYSFEPPLAYFLGLMFGTGISALKLRLMAKSIEKTLDMEQKDAQNYARLQYVFRYFLTLIAIIPAILLRDYIGLIGLILGMLSLQFAAYIAGIIERRAEKRRFAEHGVPPPLSFDYDDCDENDADKKWYDQ